MPTEANEVDAALQEVNESENGLEFPAVLESDGFVFRIKWLGKTLWDSWEDERDFDEKESKYELLGPYLMKCQADVLDSLNSEMKDRVARLHATSGVTPPATSAVEPNVTLAPQGRMEGKTL